MLDGQLEEEQRIRMLIVKLEKPADQRGQVFPRFMRV